MKITVLMSTYNGERYLKEQLDSIFNQDIEMELFVLVRDDGSKDNTVEILKEYEKTHKNFKWYQNSNVGPYKSFWKLIKDAPKSDFYAFSDQDDVWDKDKLSCGVKQIQSLSKDEPILYFADVRIVDENLNELGGSMTSIDFPINPANALINNVAPGCTYIFNAKLAELARMLDDDKQYLDMHDWMIYRLAMFIGSVINDKEPHMSYRQHGDNSIGAVTSKIKHHLRIFKERKDKERIQRRSNAAKTIENLYLDLIPEDKKHILHLVATYREDKAAKKELLKYKGFEFSFKSNLLVRHHIRKNLL